MLKEADAVYKKTADAVVKELETDKVKGLSDAEVEKRRVIYGLNELKVKEGVNPFVIFFKQFKSFIIYILLFALLISFVIKEYTDATVIFIILIFNAFFGFIQEYKAEKAIAALKRIASLKAKVIRNGKEIEVDSKEIVPGDIVILEEGDKIPADGRIIDNFNLQVLESSLTGESVPVSKKSEVLNGDLALADRKNLVFSSTLVTRGRAKYVVIGTGMNTEIGKIATMISEVEKVETPLQKKLDSFGKWIGMGVILISILIFAIEIIREGLISFITSGQYYEFIVQSKDALLTAIALAVAAVPEGLPAIVTISLAIGVRKMLDKHSLVRRLPSVETLGETSVICSDKTGTLTKNEMTVRKVYANLQDFEISGDGYSIKGNVTSKGKKLNEKDSLIFKIGSLCNNASFEKDGENALIKGDPTEAALLISAAKAGMDYRELQNSWKRIDEEPFDSIRKMMSTLNDGPGKKKYVFTKGAPERVLDKCDRILVNGKIIKLRKDVRDKILDKNKEYAEQALRVLAFAYKEHKAGEVLEKNLIFAGLQGMIDPPHEEVKNYVQKCITAGIRVIMVTGDNKYTAAAIAREVGINGDVIEGVEFSKLDEKERMQKIQNISVFARVEPTHKMEIVQLLQMQGKIVAMTGDGVNDAPAIKKADIGIAMGIKGTDVAKESSDMILQDDNFTTIVDSIEEGRGIYENIKKFVNYLLSSNLAEVLVIFAALLMGWPLPMTAIMLLWINLVTDGLPALALSVDPNPKNLMAQPPKKASERIMNKSMVFNVVYMGTLMALAVLWLFAQGMQMYSDDLIHAQTIAFSGIIVMELVRLYSIRSEYRLGIFSNIWLVLAVLGSIALLLVVLYTPLQQFFGVIPLLLKDWIYIVGASFGVFVLNFIGIAIKRKMAYFRE